MSMEALREKCAKMKELQGHKQDLEDQLAVINIALDDLRLKEIPAMMESLGCRNATFEGLGRVQLASDIYASTREGKKEAAMQWLRDCGYENMITDTVNGSTLKALFRRQIEAGIEIPEDIFSVTPFIRASIVKA